MEILLDYKNRSVRLTEERLAHILKHPELENLAGEIKFTIAHPQKVYQSKTDLQVQLSYRWYVDTLIGNKWLCIVTKYLENDAFILTAYFTDKIKDGELLWEQIE